MHIRRLLFFGDAEIDMTVVRGRLLLHKTHINITALELATLIIVQFQNRPPIFLVFAFVSGLGGFVSQVICKFG